jgi:hypothetical protein
MRARFSVVSLIVGATLCAWLAATAVAAPPTVTIGSVANPTYTTVEVTGTADPAEAGEQGIWFFQVSTDGGASWEPTNLSGSFGQPVEGTIEGLRAGANYLVRLGAYNFNEFVEVFSSEPSSEFSTAPVPLPAASIDPVSAHTGTTADLSGYVTANSPAGDPSAADVQWHFECSPGCTVATEGTVSAGQSEAVHAQATGLEPNSEYSVTLVAANAGQSVLAGPVNFRTDAVGPEVESIPAFAFGDEGLLGGRVNPRNSQTEYWFEYGPGPAGPGASFPSSSPPESAGSGGTALLETQKVGGLQPGATYHFRIVASNGVETTYGEAVSFFTPPGSGSGSTGCPNEQLRIETGSTALEECRAYEMVSPPQKNGGDVAAVMAFDPAAGRVGYVANLALSQADKANTQWTSDIAVRSPAGWASAPMQPPVEVPNLASLGGYPPADFTSDVSKALFSLRNGAADEPGVANVFLTDLGGTRIWASAPTGPTGSGEAPDKLYAGRSANGAHIFFGSGQSFDGAGNGQNQVWEWAGGRVRLASVMPGGGPVPQGAFVGSGENERSTANTSSDNGSLPEPAAVSENGSRVFFGTPEAGVYVREDANVTRRLDLSQRSGSVGEGGAGTFVGAAVDGSVVYFTSESQLTDDASPGGGLYVADVEAGNLRFVTFGAQLRGIVQISRDGSRVYFVSGSVLVPGKGAEGADNLYAGGPNGIDYIATLNEDDGAVWQLNFHFTFKRSSQLSADGRHLIFTSFERLTAFDNGGHAEVYEYDAEDASITCISCGIVDRLPDGDASIVVNPPGRGEFAQIQIPGQASIVSSDGGSVLFQTSQSLAGGDVDGVRDVYLYNQGRTLLISGGKGKYASEIGGITPDGSDAFFITRDPLVAQDTDGGARDVYDARVEGGFPAPTVVAGCESAGTCHPRAPAPPRTAAPLTTSNGPGNPPHRPRPRCRRKTGETIPCRHRAKHRKKRHKHHRHASQIRRTR